MIIRITKDGRMLWTGTDEQFMQQFSDTHKVDGSNIVDLDTGEVYGTLTVMMEP